MKTMLTAVALATLLAYAAVSPAFADCQSDDKALAGDIAAMPDGADKTAASASLNKAMTACAANDMTAHDSNYSDARSHSHR